jgi:hypothetical protein
MGATAILDANQVLAEAERCRREARTKVESNSLVYSELLCQPSGWCVVTERYTWSRRFHTMIDEDQLRERIERGHKVVLTVGLVANPNIPLTPSNHIAVISLAEPRTHKPETLSSIGVRAKRYAATALYKS